jgi:hypothetical protein
MAYVCFDADRSATSTTATLPPDRVNVPENLPLDALELAATHRTHLPHPAGDSPGRYRADTSTASLSNAWIQPASAWPLSGYGPSVRTIRVLPPSS